MAVADAAWGDRLAGDEGAAEAKLRRALADALGIGDVSMSALIGYSLAEDKTLATLPYALQLAVLGPLGAVRANPEVARGVNIWRGRIVYPAVAAAVGETPLPLSDLR